MAEPAEVPAVDPRSGQEVRRWIESRWPDVGTELSESANSYLLHVWVRGTCLVLERRDSSWGFTPDLAADEPGFDSGHPVVSSHGGELLVLIARTLDGLGEP